MKIIELEQQKAEKDRELTQLRRKTVKHGYIDEASIEMKVADSDVEGEQLSDQCIVGGVPFQIQFKANFVNGIKKLGVYLICAEMTQTFYIKADAKFTLRSGLIEKKTSLKPSFFSPVQRCRGIAHFIDVECILASADTSLANYFSFVAEIGLVCHYKQGFATFTAPDQFSDVIVVVGEREFNLNKMHLARYCEYFKIAFYSDFSEKDQARLNLTDAGFEPNEFEEMLRFLHPQRTRARVTKDSVDYLLRLGNYLNVPAVIWECIDYIRESKQMKLRDKLQITDVFWLPELQIDLLSQVNDYTISSGIIYTQEFESYSASLRGCLLEKHHAFSKGIQSWKPAMDTCSSSASDSSSAQVLAALPSTSNSINAHPIAQMTSSPSLNNAGSNLARNLANQALFASSLFTPGVGISTAQPTAAAQNPQIPHQAQASGSRKRSSGFDHQ